MTEENLGKRTEHGDGIVEIELTEREIQIMRFLVNGRCNVLDARAEAR